MSDRTEQVIGNINNVRASDYRSYYSNNAAMLSGFFEISLIFGEAQGVDQNGILTVEQKAKIILAPLQAKSLAVLLIQQLNLYEQRFGVLKLTGDMISPELMPYLEKLNELMADMK